MRDSLKVLWLCGLPLEVQQQALGGKNCGAHAAWSWVMAHLPPPEGIELHIACPARHLSKDQSVKYRGAVFHLFPDLRGSVYTCYRLWMPGFRRVFNRVRPDWVHGWGVEAGFGSAATMLAPRTSCIEIQGILSVFFPYMKKNIPFLFALANERHSLIRGQRFIAESQYSADKASVYTSGRVIVVDQPLRNEFIVSPIGTGEAKEIIFLGTLDERKGIEDAIRAFAKTQIVDWTLVCIGKGERKYVQKLKNMAGEMGVSSRISIYSELSAAEIVERFQRSSVLLLPTYMDTGPNSLKEAMAMGLWPVCYDNSGPGEFIRRYNFGALSPTGEVAALAESLRQAMKERPWFDRVRQEECVRRIRHDLDRETIWRKLIACYTQEWWQGRESVAYE